MKHIIAVLLENEPGALSRVVALFSARGYNIESLTVAPTEDRSLSRMTIVTTGSDEVIEQITKHLNRLIEVVKVVDLTEGSYTERELMLVKTRPHRRRHREELHARADRRCGQARRVLAGRRPQRHPRDGAHRRQRHWPRRAHPQTLTTSPAGSSNCNFQRRAT